MLEDHTSLEDWFHPSSFSLPSLTRVALYIFLLGETQSTMPGQISPQP
jgi:hypothetical protein